MPVLLYLGDHVGSFGDYGDGGVGAVFVQTVGYGGFDGGGRFDEEAGEGFDVPTAKWRVKRTLLHFAPVVYGVLPTLGIQLIR